MVSWCCRHSLIIPKSHFSSLDSTPPSVSDSNGHNQFQPINRVFVSYLKECFAVGIITNDVTIFVSQTSLLWDFNCCVSGLLLFILVNKWVTSSLKRFYMQREINCVLWNFTYIICNVLSRVNPNEFVLQVIAAMCSKVPFISAAIMKATGAGMSLKTFIVALIYFLSFVVFLLIYLF